MDTVEWGSAAPVRRRLPGLWRAVPRLGALALAALGFGALVLAELVPWGTVHLTSTVANVVSPTNRVPYADGAGLTLDHLQGGEVVGYHLGELVLLAVLGLGLAGAASRRRAVAGAAVGLSAGMTIPILSLYHATAHYFDDFSGYFSFGGPDGQPLAQPTVSVASGGYLALLGVGLLAAAAIASGLWQRGWWRRQVGAVAPGAPVPRPGPEDRQLTVSALEPLDEAYFARPDSR